MNAQAQVSTLFLAHAPALRKGQPAIIQQHILHLACKQLIKQAAAPSAQSMSPQSVAVKMRAGLKACESPYASVCCVPRKAREVTRWDSAEETSFMLRPSCRHLFFSALRPQCLVKGSTRQDSGWARHAVRSFSRLPGNIRPHVQFP